MAETPPISNTPYPVVAQPATGTLTAGMSASDARAVLNNLGINVNDVLSGQNIQQTIPSPSPRPDDLLGIRAGIYDTTGVNQAQTAYQQALAASQAATQGLNTRLQQLSNRPVSLSKITGQQAQEREVSSNEINALNDAAQLALQTYQAKKGEADTQFGIRESEIKDKRALQTQYSGAGIKLTDSFDDAIKKIDKYAGKQKKEAYKDALKKQALALGLKTKGSTKDLEKRLRKASKESLDMAKQESELKLEALRMDIENTRSTITNRGSENEKDVIGATIEITDPNNPLNTILLNKRTGKPIDTSSFFPKQEEEAQGNGWWDQFNVTNPSTWFNF